MVKTEGDFQNFSLCWARTIVDIFGRNSELNLKENRTLFFE